MGKFIGICALALAVAQPACADETPWSVSRRGLSCPEAVRATDPISIQIAPGAGRELAVRRTKDGVWFFLVVALPPAGQRNLLEPAELARGANVQIPADLQWSRWEPGAKAENVFRPGLYELYLSDNLESEVGGFMCSFKITSLSPNNSSKPTRLRGAA